MTALLPVLFLIVALWGSEPPGLSVCTWGSEGGAAPGTGTELQHSGDSPEIGGYSR